MKYQDTPYLIEDKVKSEFARGQLTLKQISNKYEVPIQTVQKWKLTKKALRGAIQYECIRDELTMREIARKFGVSVSTAQKWKGRETTDRKKRKGKSKLNQKAKRFIYKSAASKFTGSENASSRRIANKLFSKLKIKVSHMTVSRYLGKTLSKAR